MADRVKPSELPSAVGLRRGSWRTGARTEYQWYRGSEPIPGETGREFQGERHDVRADGREKPKGNR